MQLSASLAWVVSAASGAQPKWPPTWDMASSTLFMPCNYSGFLDASISAKWGVVDFDWSNAKGVLCCLRCDDGEACTLRGNGQACDCCAFFRAMDKAAPDGLRRTPGGSSRPCSVREPRRACVGISKSCQGVAMVRHPQNDLISHTSLERL